MPVSYGERMPKSKRDQQLVAWAKRNVRGLDSSAAFLAVLNDGPMNKQRVEFTLHIGHAVLHDKPIIVAVPHGQPLPDKVQRVADRVVRYDPADIASVKPALAQALAELGITKQ